MADSSHKKGPTEYTRRWAVLRALDVSMLLVPVLFIPVILVARSVTQSATVERVAGGIWIMSFVVLLIVRAFWRCPRCSKPFHWKELHHNPFSLKCLHCDLPKRATEPIQDRGRL